MKSAVVLPLKEANAKFRMSRLLSADERARLAWAMFEDVARALARLPRSTPVIVVTSSGRAIERARALGWRALREHEQISESASVDRACRLLAEEGFEAALRIPADVPLIEPEDVELVLDAAPGPPATVLVPSRDGLGTNALLRRPPDLFPARFGPNSLVLHRQEALRAQAEIRVLELARLALDLDEASDLVEFLESRSETETRRALETLGIDERVARHA